MKNCHTDSAEVNVIDELENDFLRDVAEFFKVFGDVTRIRILQSLLTGEKNVTELADLLDISQSAISHQLRVLRQNNLVKYRKEGKTVFYSLDDEHVQTILEQGMVHIRHKRGYAE
ncbi:ArsR/SmtB family transcription factor [Anaerotignum sp.]|uniref:ArsR/SmtB family transcription factor n=1 Tax=Anaerotignum sp. TaxID=2039241 RepID=UPI002714A985|nr:metalloregulator ArsR/SmtB family transcription factor [Anaerotignum sp.]